MYCLVLLPLDFFVPKQRHQERQFPLFAADLTANDLFQMLHLVFFRQCAAELVLCRFVFSILLTKFKIQNCHSISNSYLLKSF